MSKINLLQRHRVALLVAAVCVLAISPMILALGGDILAQGVGNPGIDIDSIRRSSHELIVEALNEEIALLKWIGGGIVASLATTIALLWKALEKANKSSRDDLVEGIRRREKIIETCLEGMQESTEAVKELSGKVDSLLGRVER